VSTQLIIDVVGYFTSSSLVELPAPYRISDSRANGSTFDGLSKAYGPVPAGGTVKVEVATRQTYTGHTSVARTVILTVTAVNPAGNGYFTVWPCGQPMPLASNLNVKAGVNFANTVFMAVGDDNEVCIYTSTQTHLVVDFDGDLALGDRQFGDMRDAQSNKGVSTQEELADIATDDLVELTALDAERAKQLIMAARAPWFAGPAAAAGGAGCGSCKQEPCVDKSKAELEACKLNSDRLQAEVNSLKRQLAQALANPGSIKVDPSVLVIDGKPIRVNPREGSLTQEQAAETLRQNLKQNYGALQSCYERAMKKNTALTHQRIVLTVGFQVQPSGTPANITISPNYDSLMMDCLKKAIMRWRFPSFSGQPVGVETPLTLQPRK
jgi:transcription termination factor NusA